MSRLVLVRICGQRAGIPVRLVRSVIGPRKIWPVPGAHPIVAGVLNLRGRIVTAIDVARCLGISADPPEAGRFAVVVEPEDGARYALLVDAVEEIATLTGRVSEAAEIARLLPGWERYVPVVHDTPGGVVLELDVPQLIEPALAPGRAA